MARATLKARATLDSRDFNTKLTKMGQNVDAFGSGTLARLGGAIGGAFAVGAVTRFARTQLEAADRTADLVSILGVSAEAFQALEVSALKYGGTIAQIEKGVQVLRRAQGEAIQGTKEYADSFKRLGITQDELSKLGTEDLLDRVARGFVNAENEASALADIQAILGRSGIELAGVLREVGEDGLQTVIDKAREAGQILSNEMVQQLADINNQLELMEKRASATATTTVVGSVNKLAAGYRNLMSALSGGSKTFENVLLTATGGTTLLAIGKLLGFVDKSRRAAAEMTGADSPDAPDAAAQISQTVLDRAASIRAAAAQRMGGVTVSAPRAADRLSTIGGFVGAQTSPMQGAMERAAKAAEISAKADEKIAQLAEKNGLTLEEIRTALEE